MEDVRKDFPFLETGLIYLDSAATTQKPQSVIDAMAHFYANEYATVHRSIYTASINATEKYCNARSKVQNYINAKAVEEVVFTRSTTEAINLVAHSFTRAFLKPGDAVLISNMEHHSNIVPWQLVLKERDIELRVLSVKSDGTFDLAAFERALTPKVKLISITHLSNLTGIIFPIEQIIALAHKRGAKVLVDGAQVAGHFPIDVQALDADFYAFSAHKMYGPTGIGVLYGKLSLLEAMPPFQGGGDMIESVSFENTLFQPPPLRFEAGTPPIAQVIGFGAAIDYITDLGQDTLRAWEETLTQYALATLQEIDTLHIIGSTTAPRGTLIAFTIEGCHPLDIATLLNLQNIAVRSGTLCTEPALRFFGTDAALRASFGIYNTIEEIDALKRVLESSIAIASK